MRLLLGIAAAAVFAFGTGAVLAAITPQTGPAGALAIANAMAATPGIVTGAMFVTTTGGATTPNGTSNAPLTQFPTKGTTFGILTSGDVNNVDNPGTFTNVDDGGGVVAGRGSTAFDITVLKIDLLAPPASNCLTFDFKFLSEEFPFYVNTRYNDAFIAELDSSTWTTVGVSTITAPDNFAFDSSHNVVSINSTGLGGMSAAQGAGTAFDSGGDGSPPGPAADQSKAGGATGLLSASKQITPGPHSLYLSIFDQGDLNLDSAVFLDNLRIGFVTNPAVNCKAGAQPVNFQLTLDPAFDTNLRGTPHTVTATLTNSDGIAVAGVTVAFAVSGANVASGTGITNSGGEATFTYTGLNLGDDTIAACYDADANGSCEAQASATKKWVIGPPKTLTLLPATAVNAVGTQHCVTATVKDLAGNLVPGAPVTFTVVGANTLTTTINTDVNGQAMLCYTGTALGMDVITAEVTGTTATATAAKTWVAPVVDHYKCYDADQEGSKTKNKKKTVVTLEDQFDKEKVSVDPDGMCNPVNKNLEGVVQPAAHLKSYDIADVKGEDFAHFQKRRVTVRNQFGTDEFKVVKAETLLAPSSKSEIPPAVLGADSGPPPPFIDHYKCYKTVQGKVLNIPVVLDDQFGHDAGSSVYRAALLCNPVKKEHDGVVTNILPRLPGTPDHLVCYKLRSHNDDDDDHDGDDDHDDFASHDDAHHKHGAKLVNMHDQFGKAVLRIENAETLCVPSKVLNVVIAPPGDDDDDDHDDGDHHD